jgi:DNA gyrase/topoisomerase IV subunit B
MANKAEKTIGEKYRKHELRDHVYNLPDTYVGSAEKTQVDTYVYDDASQRMVKKEVTYVPALLKIVDEIVVNAIDQTMRLKAPGTPSDAKQVKNIWITANKDTGRITVTNDGDGIDIDKHPEHKVWIPELIFGELLTSSNYDQTEEKVWGGKNGIGLKSTNIFSLELIAETVDHRRKKIYTQRFFNNMKERDAAVVKSFSKAPFTRISFLPDYARFGMKGMTDDMFALFRKRAFDACATTSSAVSVYFNEELLQSKTFERYTDLYLGEKAAWPRAYEASADGRWEVVATYSEHGQFDQVSFVNGINTLRGGKHVDYITNQITKDIVDIMAKKKRAATQQHVKANLMVFVKSLIVNPSFDSQSKETLNTPVAKFGSKFEVSDKFIATLFKTGIAERASSLTAFHENKAAKKTDGKKTSRVIVPKLNDANLAGTKHSQECTLILTEGDSAASMAIAGLSVVGRDRYGVFPLKGKILNVKDAAVSKISENDEITNLKKILGLQQGKNYTDTSELRYGKIMLMTDQDSVIGDTPMLIRNISNHMMEIKTIEDLNKDWTVNANGKEYGLVRDYEVWTDSGWTTIKHIMRHKCEKEIYRVLTHTGIVDVTEDHSLLNKHGQKITPKECTVNQELLHSFPKFEENRVHIPDDLESLELLRDMRPLASACKVQYSQLKTRSDMINTLQNIKDTVHYDLSVPVEITQDEAWVMGLFWADGTSGTYQWKTVRHPPTREYTFTRTSHCWSISNCDLSLLEKAKNIMEKKYDYNFKIIEDRSNAKKNAKCSMSYKLIANGGVKTKPMVDYYTSLFYYMNDHPRYKKGNKIIPPIILNAPRAIREHFLSGYYCGDGSGHDINNLSLAMDIESKISTQSIYFLCKSLGYEVSINHNSKKPAVYSLNISKGFMQDNPNRIKKIFNLGIKDAYVYDLETDNHHFQAGIGQMIVHNTDGFHIKGLMFNVFGSLWPSLYKSEGFLTAMMTPILRTFNKSTGESISFYNISDYEKWKSNKDTRGWTLKYYKGLGTSTQEEAKGYFAKPQIMSYIYSGQPSDESIDLAFNKKRADDRKAWLMQYDRNLVLDYTEPKVSYEDFVHKELIHFSNNDLERSINHMCDGLKESTRKILFGCLKRRLFKNEIKVAQLAAYVSEHSAYHHGEASLQQAITGMAQTFVGTNNINLLVPNGQFGGRIAGGSDAASPRYIYTLLSPLARAVYRDEDAPILKYLDDDGTPVEPTYYMPIVPMVLVNGALGIGTGFSTNLPQHNPSDIIQQCMTIISALDAAFKNTSSQPNQPQKQIQTEADLLKATTIVDTIQLPDLTPFYLGFTGSIVTHKEGSYASRGVYRWVDDTTVEVTELPIGTWSQDYKEFLESLVANNNPVLKDFESHYTAQSVRFLLKLHNGVRQGIEHNFETEFKLVSTKNLSLNNIHLYNEKGAIKKYKDTKEVLREWTHTRLEKYVIRKDHQLKQLEQTYTILSAKVRFIQDIINNKIKIMNKKIKEVEVQLQEAKYPTITEEVVAAVVNDDISGEPVLAKSEGGYAYLTKMPINQLTYEKKLALEKEADDINMKITTLRETPIHHIWRRELVELSKVWEDHRSSMEDIYKADRENKAPATSGKKPRSIKK